MIADLEEVVADNRSCQRTAITFAESCNLMDKQFAESVNREKLIRKNLEFERELHAKTTKELAAAQARERHTRDTLNTVLGLPPGDSSALDAAIAEAVEPYRKDAERLDLLGKLCKETPLRPNAFCSEIAPDTRLRYDFPTLVSYDSVGNQISLRDAIDAAIAAAKENP